ncbi:hypothetical protein ACFWAT_11630 [Streptomyces syringium]|uniref:hypothetical protein n=1 Tax=Streptomyces syringium TaxID=76729 RepID=UPI00366814AA
MKLTRKTVGAALAAVALTAGMTSTAEQATAKAPMAHTGIQGAPVVVPAHATRTATVTCPADQQVSGGGGVVDGGGLLLTGSNPNGRVWEAKFSNDSNVQRTGSAFAVCTDLTQSVFRSSTVIITPGSNQAQVVRCPPGQNPTGGGFTTTGTDVPARIISSTQESWHVRAVNNGTATQDMQAVVLCSGVPHENRLGTPVTVQAGGEVTATVNCPANQVASGGAGQGNGNATFIADSRALPDVRGWQIRGVNRDNVSRTFIAQVICTAP